MHVMVFSQIKSYKNKSTYKKTTIKYADISLFFLIDVKNCHLLLNKILLKIVNDKVFKIKRVLLIGNKEVEMRNIII